MKKMIVGLLLCQGLSIGTTAVAQEDSRSYNSFQGVLRYDLLEQAIAKRTNQPLKEIWIAGIRMPRNPMAYAKWVTSLSTEATYEIYFEIFNHDIKCDLSVNSSDETLQFKNCFCPTAIIDILEPIPYGELGLSTSAVVE